MAKARLPVLLGVLALLLAVFGGSYAWATGRPLIGVVVVGAILAFVAAYVVAILIAVAIHELGHLLAGRAVGFEFRNLVIGPFGWRTEAGRAVRYRVRPARIGGFVSMVPRDDRAFLRRYAMFILGGPLASVLWTAATFGAWRASGIPDSAGLPHTAPLGTRVADLLALSGLLGAVVVLPATLVPYRSRRAGFPTDALWLLLLLRGGDETRRLVAVMTLTRMLLAGAEAEDLPPALLEEATRLKDGTVSELNAVTLRWAATAERDRAMAGAMIARHASIHEAMGASLAEPIRSWARAIQASDAVFYEKDVERGAAWMEGTVEPPDPTMVATMRLTAAGLAALRGDSDRAERLQKAEAAVEDAAPRTTVSWRTERARLAALLAGWPREELPDAPPARPI